MSEPKPLSIHPKLLQVLIPDGVHWKIGLDENDVKYLLEGNKFTRYQIAGGENIADAISFFKPEKFRKDKECKVLTVMRLKKPYEPTITEVNEIHRFISDNIQSDDFRWGFGIDENLTDNVAITIAASYKYVIFD